MSIVIHCVAVNQREEHIRVGHHRMPEIVHCVANTWTNRTKRREQNLFVCSSKSEAKVTIIEDCTRHSVLLKLTTDRHETSHSLSATAGLRVEYVSWECVV